MTDHNPFLPPSSLELPNDSPTRLSLLEQLAVFVVTFIAVVTTFFGTCFGSFMLGSLLDPLVKGNSELAVFVFLLLIVGLPLLFSGLVLVSVRRSMTNRLLRNKTSAADKETPPEA